ncbi:MAG: tetratricopeptide repeat protein, partial [Bacteroidota bacterium]
MTTESLRYGWSLTPWHTAIPVSVLGIVAYQEGNLKEAFRQLSDSLAAWRTVGDPRGLVFCMLYLGMTALALNDTATTRSVIQESNTIAEAKMDRWAHAFGLDLLGMVCLAEGQNEEALDYFQHSLEHYRQIGDTLNSTQTLIHLGQAYTALECLDDAKRLYVEAYATALQAGWIPIILVALVAFIEMEKSLAPQTKLAIALSVLAHPSVTPNLRARSERMRDEIRSRLAPERIEAAQELAGEKTAESWAEEIIT